MWPEIVEIVEKLLRVRPPTRESVGEALDVTMAAALRSASFDLFSSAIADGPFGAVEFRRSHDGARAKLHLTPRAGVKVVEDAAAMELFGPRSQLDIVESGREGIVVQEFAFRGARVSLAFSKKSRVLEGVTINWF
jgi:hypothetical protein